MNNVMNENEMNENEMNENEMKLKKNHHRTKWN